MTTIIPFAEVCQTQDRSWSFRLIAELKNLAELKEGQLNQAYLDKLSTTLASLDDPRIVQPLTEILLDQILPDSVRLAASDTLWNSTTYETADERAQWWSSGDETLMRHAVRMAEREEEDLIVSIACNPEHQLYAEAIDKLAFWFEPRFQKLVIEALNHKSPDTRKIAAMALLWEQPVEAERRLLEIAAEPDREAALAALDTLNYCASQEILLTLADLITNTADEEMKAEYKHTFELVAKEFREYLIDYPWYSEAARAYFENWAIPARERLKKEGLLEECLLEDGTADSGSSAKSEKSAELESPATNENESHGQALTKKAPKANDFELDVDKILKDLSEDDGKWLAKSYRYFCIDGFEKFSPSERDRLLNFLTAHIDPIVREIATRACLLWKRNDVMLVLLKDRSSTIRKMSAYRCRFLPADEQLAGELMLILNDKDTDGTMATEALESYLVHTPGQDNRDWLLALALKDKRPAVRNTAVNQLYYADDRAQIEQLLPILLEPPCNTWSLHKAIVDACCDLNIPLPESHLAHLMEVDNLELQASLAELIGSKTINSRTTDDKKTS